MTNMRLSKDAHMALPKKLFTKDNLKIPQEVVVAAVVDLREQLADLARG